MLVNFSNGSFYDDGLLIDDEYGTLGKVRVVLCRPCRYLKDMYLFADCLVDVNHDWVDKGIVNAESVRGDDLSMAGKLAMGCIDYYGVDSVAKFTCVCDREKVDTILSQLNIKLDTLVCK